MSEPDREALEQLWRTRLTDAKLRLEFARNYMKEVQRDLDSEGIPSPDGQFAYQKARRAENEALAEYHRLLRIVTDLCASGKVPEADSSSAGGSGNAA